MIILASTTDSIRAITSAAATVDVHASWIDNAASVVTPGRTDTAITTATTTTIVAAPAASTQRAVREIFMRNKHASLSTDITIQHLQSGVAFDILKFTVAAGQTLQYIGESGWTVL